MLRSTWVSSWLSVERRALSLNRLHSLTGCIALGGFLLLHLWTQGQALGGWEAYDRAVWWAGRSWPVRVLEVLLIYLPLSYHAAYGLSVILRPAGLRQRRSSLSRGGYRKGWARALQHSTGAITLAFIVFHLWQFRWPLWLGQLEARDVFPLLCAQLSSTNSWGIPLFAFVYLAGSAACIAHFCNGLSAACFHFGLTQTRRTARRVAWACGALGVLLFAFACLTVLYLATGSTPAQLLG